MMSIPSGARAHTLFGLFPRFKVWLGLAAVALASAAVPAHALTFMFQDIVNNSDVTFNQELGINNAGMIAGYFGSGAAGHPNKGYTVVAPYGQANFTNENFTGSMQTQVTGLNNTGTTVGFWSDQNNVNMVNNNFGFVDIANTFTNVNNPATGTGPAINQLLGVNNSNIAVGFYVDTTGATHGYTYNIAAKTFSTNIDDPFGVGTTTAAAINNNGQIAGFYVGTDGNLHGFFDNAGTFTTINAPGAMDTSLLGLNDLGEAVGVQMLANGNLDGIICNVFTATCQAVDDPAGIGTTTFNGLNDGGQVVGFYVNGGGNTIGLLANPIPEPSSLLLLAGGLLGMGALARRRRVA